MFRKCLSRMAASVGITFVTLLASAENIEKYLFGTAVVWMIGGSITAAAWAYEHFCHGNGGTDD